MFEKKLKALLKKHNLSVTEIANRTSVPRSTVQLWLSGSTPNIYQLEKVASYFEMSLDELVFDKRPKSAIDELLESGVVHSAEYRIEIRRIKKHEKY